MYGVNSIFVYGDGSCTSCHADPNDGKLLTEYRSAFRSQPVYKTDSVMALRYIGKPPGAIPVNTPVITIVTPVVTDTIPVATIPTVVVTTPATTEIIPVVTTPIVTEVIPVVTAAPTIATNDKNTSVAVEKAEENSEKDEVNKQSPGFDTIFTAGIVLTMYTLGRLLTRKDEEI